MFCNENLSLLGVITQEFSCVIQSEHCMILITLTTIYWIETIEGYS